MVRRRSRKPKIAGSNPVRALEELTDTFLNRGDASEHIRLFGQFHGYYLDYIDIYPEFDSVVNISP